MIKLRLKRIAYKDTYTIGKLFINEEFFCDTLEDKYRGDELSKTKVMGQTAIPKGTYQLTLRQSPKFKRLLPRFLAVPFFESILIHRGSTANDSAGCILVGENKIVGRLINSALCETKLIEILKKDSDISIIVE